MNSEAQRTIREVIMKARTRIKRLETKKAIIERDIDKEKKTIEELEKTLDN